MRILFLANRFDSSANGGVENYLRSASRWYIENGHEVSVISRKWNSGDPSEENANGVRIIRMPPPHIQGLSLFIKPILLERHFRRNLTSIIDVERPDCIVARNPLWASSALKSDSSIPLIYIPSSIDRLIENAGCREASANGSLFKYLWKFQISSIEKYALRHASRVVVFSDAIRRQLCALYGVLPQAFVRIPPGVDPTRFTPGKDDSLRTRLGISREEVVVLSVCRLSPEKSLDSVLRSMDGTENWRWVIVGDGPEKKHLQALSSSLGERVIFAGASISPEQWYRAADIFLLPSVYETFGQVLLEAMASGLPCVARKPSPPEVDTASDEIIDDQKTGFLFDDGKGASLIDTVNYFVRNEDARREYGQRGRMRVLEKFGWDAHFEKLIKQAESNLPSARE